MRTAAVTMPAPTAWPRARPTPLSRLPALLACVFILALFGCTGERSQSALHPAGEPAARIADLWWIMLGVLGIFTLGVFVLLALAVFVQRREGPATPPLGTTAFVLVGGILLPAVILVGLLLASLDATRAIRGPAAAMRIEVIGHQWWWEVRYPDAGIVTANEITLPVGQPVRVDLRSADVIHSFWVPNLHGKMDVMPDHLTRFWLQADRAGAYRGQCAEFCGPQHARMAFEVLATPVAAFDAWVAAQRVEPPPPQEPQRRRGLAVYQAQGCATCHAISGVSTATAGPDLTHVGSRRTLAAGVVPNTPAKMATWITEPQAIKPGSLMPATPLAPDELEALVAYLEGLK